MLFSAHNLRYHLEECFPSFCAFLQQRAQRFLGPLKYDSFEVDQVVEHIIDHLTRLRLLGGGDNTPLTALDRLSDAQFYAFLNRSVKNKAIDRLRRHRLPMSTVAELEGFGGAGGAASGSEERDPFSDVVESLWGNPPFPTPENAALQVASQQELRQLLKQCIKALGNAPRQLQAVIQELEELGAEELVQNVRAELPGEGAGEPAEPVAHLSQHKDHAHKKLRHCLQKNSTNLAVMIAFRLTQCGIHSTANDEVSATVQTLVRGDEEQEELSKEDVHKGLRHLTAKGLLDWNGEEVIRFSSVQEKRLARFYEQGE